MSWFHLCLADKKDTSTVRRAGLFLHRNMLLTHSSHMSASFQTEGQLSLFSPERPPQPFINDLVKVMTNISSPNGLSVAHHAMYFLWLWLKHWGSNWWWSGLGSCDHSVIDYLRFHRCLEWLKHWQIWRESRPPRLVAFQTYSTRQGSLLCNLICVSEHVKVRNVCVSVCVCVCLCVCVCVCIAVCVCDASFNQLFWPPTVFINCKTVTLWLSTRC